MVSICTIPWLSPCLDDSDSRGYHLVITLTCRLLIIITPDTRHFPYFALLSKLRGCARYSTSRLQSSHSTPKHCRLRAASGPCWLFWHLRQPRWRLMAVQQQCHGSGQGGVCRSRSPQLDLVGCSIQRHGRVSLLDHHCHHLCFHLPASLGHLPRVARRGRFRRLRPRSQALPLSSCLASRPRHHLHRVHLRPRLRPLATHRLRCSIRHSTRLWQRCRQEWCRNQRHGSGLVLVYPAHHRYHWSARHDIEYTGPEPDGITRICKETKNHTQKFLNGCSRGLS